MKRFTNRQLAIAVGVILLILCIVFAPRQDELAKRQHTIDTQNEKYMTDCISKITSTGNTYRQRVVNQNKYYYKCLQWLVADVYTWGANTSTVYADSSVVINDYRNDFQCIKRQATNNIEFHYTASDYSNQKTNEAKLLAIWNAHVSSKWRVQWSGIGYHYVIATDGTIYNTRNVDCTAIADWEGGFDYFDFEWEKIKVSKHNSTAVHVSFIGDDKPTPSQTTSMVYLSRMLMDKYKLDESAITSHWDRAAKSKMETLAYWFGWRWNFIKLIPENNNYEVVVDSSYIEWKRIFRKGANLEWLQYAYDISHGDMDFINTIEVESRWDLNSVWDNGNSFGLCQFNSNWHADKIATYKAYSNFWKVDYCYMWYKKWKTDWVIFNMLHWYSKRNSVTNTFTFR